MTTAKKDHSQNMSDKRAEASWQKAFTFSPDITKVNTNSENTILFCMARFLNGFFCFRMRL